MRLSVSPTAASPFASAVVQEPVRWIRAQSDAVDAAEVGADPDGVCLFVRSSLTGRRVALTPLAFAGLVADAKAGRFDEFVPR